MGVPSQLLVSSRELCLPQSQHPAAAFPLRVSSPAQEGFLGLGMAPLGGESRAGCLPSSAQELPSCSVAWHCRSRGKAAGSTSRAWEALGAVEDVNTWESWDLPWSHGFASWCTPAVAMRLLHQTQARGSRRAENSGPVPVQDAAALNLQKEPGLPCHSTFSALLSCCLIMWGQSNSSSTAATSLPKAPRSQQLPVRTRCW